MFRLDRAKLSRVERTPEGYLRCEAQVARTGVQEYPQPDGRILREYRPPEEVGDPDSLASFGGKAVTLEHPPVPLDAGNTRQYAVGTTGHEVVYDRGFVKVIVNLYDAEAIRSVESGETVEVSAGYEVELDPTPGVTPEGERYDAVQRRIRCNHVALTRKGRAGPAVRLLLDKEEPMRRKDQEEQQMSPESPSPDMTGIQEQMAELGSQISEMGSRLDQVFQELAALAGKVDRLLEQTQPQEPEPEPETEAPPLEEALDSLVEERMRTIAAAKRVLGEDYDWRGKKTLQIQVDALEAAGIQTEGRSPEYLQARFDALTQGQGPDRLTAALDALPPANGPLQARLEPKKFPLAYQK